MQGSQKTWGPFTGRQLVTMVCVIVVAIVVPVGAWAATLTNVAITDPGGVHRATVDATGKLAVGDGSGPLTIDGAVTGVPGLPAKPITITVTTVPNAPVVIYGPQSKRFGITSITATALPGCGDQTLILVSTTGGSNVFALAENVVKAGTTAQYTFPTPLVLTPPAGGTVSLEAEGTTNGCTAISGVGVQS